MKSGMKDDNDDKERRDVTRTRVTRNARIILPRRAQMIHCTVQNITSGGACLKFANTYGLPDTFELTFEQGRTRRACRVVWRTGDLIGVAFEEENTAA
jgi:PilZ domain